MNLIYSFQTNLQQRMEIKEMTKRAVQRLLRDNASSLKAVIDLHLGEIVSSFWSKELIPRELYQDIVNGVTGISREQQAAEVVVAMEKKLQISPDLIGNYTAVLEEFEDDFAKELGKQYKGLYYSLIIYISLISILLGERACTEWTKAIINIH